MTLENRRVLYISYNGMLEPLGQSQVIPYLKELSKRGPRFTLLSFERSPVYARGAAQAEALREELAEYHIEWHWLRYHKSPSLPATAFDLVQGVRRAGQLVQQNAIELVHARSHIPALIALRTKKRYGVKMIFDVRGLMADEYVDAEHWRTNSVPYRMTKSLERKALGSADGIVTLTEKIWPIINAANGSGVRNAVHEVIPCCVDLDRFVFCEETRRTKRAELGLPDKQRILVYSGSIGGWYLTDKMAHLFAHMLKQEETWHFLWLTTGPVALVQKIMNDLGLSDNRYTIKRAAFHEVPAYLSAADAAVAFYKPTLSRLATSPVKVAEYLACGLPVVLNAGVGDSDALIRNERVGTVIENFTDAEYEQAATAIERFTAEPELIRSRAREVAERIFDVRTVGANRYARLYERVLGGTN